MSEAGSILWYHAVRVHYFDEPDRSIPRDIYDHAVWWRVALANLGANLAAAGAACAAFKGGLEFCDLAAIGQEARAWWPGCGRPYQVETMPTIEEADLEIREAGGDPVAIGERGAALARELLDRRREALHERQPRNQAELYCDEHGYYDGRVGCGRCAAP